MTLTQPIQAKCHNRSHVTRKPRGGEPDDWWTRVWLEERGYTRATFDFFVDWRDRSLVELAWSKVLATGGSRARVRQEDASLIPSAMDVIDAVTNRSAIAALGFQHSLRLLPEPFEPPDGIGVADQSRGSLSFRKLRDLEEEIAAHSGGRFRIGSKGLTYGTSAVECFLSKTDTPWPGDVDAVIFDAVSLAPICVLEWKKHNPRYAGRIADNLFDHYYRRGDQRKWDRLAILARYLDVPLGVVYYASDASEPCIVQRLTGDDERLIVAGRTDAPHPTQPDGDAADLWAVTLDTVAPVVDVGLAAEARAGYDI